ncbi:receptor-like protein EIX2 [Silene latifolia]|uniref:receptor-like protein EIX2 n=1 Tax=Silene latifolia TaxID=37657 RepID=UPI003D7836D3
MKPFLYLILIVLSWLVLSPCICHADDLGRNHSNHIQCIDTERNALLQFKHGITTDYCGLLTSWELHTDCCRWRGVVCSNLTNHVFKLELVPSDSVSCLEGKMSPSLGELKHLEHLNLSNNIFYGEIPHQFGNLSKLTTLDLSYACINYDVQVQSWSWISRLTLLRYLDLSGANFSEVRNWIPIVNNLHSLRVLRMDGCNLPTRIPLSLSYVNSSTTLHTISLSSNYFYNSSILQWLFNLPRITTQLVHLDLSYNDFEVRIPSEFENFHNLSYLELSGNSFQGSVSKIIDDIGSLSSLRELYLSDNQLKGQLSLGVGQLTMLEILDVSSNSLEGTLTHTFFLSLVRLRELFLQDNPGLVISIEEDQIPPFKLDVIQLRSCKLGPRFPKWLLLQTNFSYFDVSNTGISDSIHISFWNTLPTNLMYLNMSNNQLYGMLPNLPQKHKPFFSYPYPLIDLSSNLFEGVVPSSFASAAYLFLNDNRFSNCSNLLCPKTESRLIDLDLSNNLFFGELPDCWMNFYQLSSLHLENNKFSGSMPKSISTLSGLDYLYLYNNSFSGPFPIAFESLTFLKFLNLGFNSFSGNIPSWIGNSFQSLGALILRKNHFIEEIPESICQLNNLQILDLAINNLSGVLPYCIGNFTLLKRTKDLKLGSHLDEPRSSETVTVSWKRKEQRFKETIIYVKYIDLSSNEFSGEIPNGISSLTALGALDLSKNNLSGYIPLEIGNMTDFRVS